MYVADESALGTEQSLGGGVSGGIFTSESSQSGSKGSLEVLKGVLRMKDG